VEKIEGIIEVRH